MKDTILYDTTVGSHTLLYVSWERREKIDIPPHVGDHVLDRGGIKERLRELLCYPSSVLLSPGINIYF